MQFISVPFLQINLIVYGFIVPSEEILEDCFVQGYRILCNDNRKVVENFLEKIENIQKEIIFYVILDQL